MGSARETAALALAACERQGAWSDVQVKRCAPGCATECCKTGCCWTGGWGGCAP